MTIAQSLLPEFDHEMATTRSLLERVPDGKNDWKPHEKSMALGQLASHVATLPGYGTVTMTTEEMDMNPPGGKSYTPPKLNSTSERLEAFDSAVKEARAVIAAAPDSDMLVKWSLKNGGNTIFSLPRTAVLRSFMMNHLIHHRAQLGVYLRLLDVPLPSSYGPTADVGF